MPTRYPSALKHAPVVTTPSLVWSTERSASAATLSATKRHKLLTVPAQWPAQEMLARSVVAALVSPSSPSAHPNSYPPLEPLIQQETSTTPAATPKRLLVAHFRARQQQALPCHWILVQASALDTSISALSTGSNAIAGMTLVLERTGLLLGIVV